MCACCATYEISTLRAVLLSIADGDDSIDSVSSYEAKSDESPWSMDSIRTLVLAGTSLKLNSNPPSDPISYTAIQTQS